MPQPRRPDTLAAYTFLDEELQALAQRGIEALVLSTVAIADGMVGGVRVHRLPPDSWRSRARTLAFAARCLPALPIRLLEHPRRVYRALRVEAHAASLVRSHGVNLVHSHFGWPYGFGGALATRATGRPLIASLRGTDILLDDSIGYGRRDDRVFARNLQILLSNARRTLYFSEFMRQQGVSLGATLSRTRVVRKGVDLQQFYVADDRAALKRQLGFGKEALVLTVGGLIERKGVHVLLDALARIRDTSSFTLAVCGDGPERARLESHARGLGLADRTRFVGRVTREKVADYFAACDVFVLASSVEAAGNVLFEAMAAARPIVCTASGGPSEYVLNGETGFVVPVGNDELLAQKIGHLLEHPDLADRLGAAGRQLAIKDFSYARMLDDITRVYSEALGRE
jgi:glycosyltransferase involved in cell wall biosynthesis